MSSMRNHPFLTKSFAVIGHRGAAGHAPENSLEAFEIAFAAGVDAIELDVKSLHNRLWVFHDDTVERLTNGTGAFHELSESQLAALRLQNDEPIPDLATVWDLVPPSIAINIELKGPNTGTPTAAFIATHSHRYLVSSFYVDELRAFTMNAPHIPTALLTRKRDEYLLATAAELGVTNVHIMDSVAEPDYLAQCIDSGFTVYIFTVNDRKRAAQLRDLGVAAVFTDVPRDMKQLAS